MKEANSQDTPVVGGFGADRSDADARLRARRGAGGRQPVVARTPTLLLFVLVAAAAGAFLLHLQRESALRDRENEQLRQELAELRSGLTEVSREVNVTGESLNETGSATQQKIRFLDSEIRKLWVVSNERNKKAIADLRTSLQELSSGLKKRDDEIAAAVKRARAAEALVKEQQALVGRLDAQFEALGKNMQELQTAVRDGKSATLDRELALQTRVDQVAAQLGVLAEQVRQATQQTQSFAESLQTNQQDIRAMDAFRRQTNRALTTLQATVNEMQQDLDAMKRVY